MWIVSKKEERRSKIDCKVGLRHIMCNNGGLPKVPLKLHILIIIKHRAEAQSEEGSATVKYCQIYQEYKL